MTTTTTARFSDRLLTAIDRKGGAPVCVGLDPVYERLPDALKRDTGEPGDEVTAIFQFGVEVIDAVADSVPAIKIQSACFERYREDGVETLYSLVQEAIDRELVVILDAKRGDIGISAEHYAAATFDPPRPPSDIVTPHDRPDAITINAYLGADGITPFLRDGHGAFALVRTSNPGGDELQTARLESGDTVAEHLARIIDRLGADHLGEMGYSDLGAVVGATKTDEIARLRELMPRAIFLVPGYGAQGAGADDVRACFRPDGRGAIVTASRSVIFAYEDDASDDWIESIGVAARRFADEVGAIL
ncbi:MAG: orotidine-5'-phosphate decarboxylase [Phycisphaerales bacterium]